MKISNYKINGTEYPLCYSLSVIMATAGKYGSLEAFFEKFNCPDLATALDTTVWIAAEMISAGCAYQRMTGKDYPAEISPEEIMLSVGIPDILPLKTAILNAINSDSKAEVELAPAKKKTATKPKAKSPTPITSGTDCKSD